MAGNTNVDKYNRYHTLDQQKDIKKSDKTIAVTNNPYCRRW